MTKVDMSVKKFEDKIDLSELVSVPTDTVVTQHKKENTVLLLFVI